MKIPKNVDKLTALFEKFGAREPRSWAESQIQEGIPQLQRFLFLRQAWEFVQDERDTSWIQGRIAESEEAPNASYAGVGAALKRCLAKGVSPQDLTDIARGLQAEALFQFCYLLDDPNFDEEELEEVAWGLFEVDQKGKPMPPRIQGLHESVLDTDPTGREMRPRQADA